MVHQPRLSLLIGLLWGCGGSPAPQPPPPTAPTTWTRTGLLSIDPQASSFPFTGARAHLSACTTPRCTAERWSDDAGRHHDLLRDGRAVWWTAAPEDKLTARWNRLNGSLAVCIGDPWSSTPGGDLAAVRTLVATDPPHTDPDARWEIHFSGANPCRLSGTLTLSARGDRVGTRALWCDGHRWSDGGPQRTRALLGFSAPPAE